MFLPALFDIVTNPDVFTCSVSYIVTHPDVFICSVSYIMTNPDIFDFFRFFFNLLDRYGN